ncbi:MAG: hypothetical protein RPS47_07730 [Colwellia sp.]|jgi:hypothetical protein
MITESLKNDLQKSIQEKERKESERIGSRVSSRIDFDSDSATVYFYFPKKEGGVSTDIEIYTLEKNSDRSLYWYCKLNGLD